jgi:hypothetical protein
MDDISSLTKDLFCERNGISKSKLRDLDKKKKGPRYMDVDGMQRISIEAEAEWRRQCEEAAKSPTPDAIKRRKKLSARLTVASRQGVKARKAMASV